jgi:hypothetical protein
MKPYGYIKTGKSVKFNIGYEDIEDIRIAGRKSSIGRFAEKCGIYKSYTRNSNSRKKARRYFKRTERMQSKNDLRKNPNIRGNPGEDNPDAFNFLINKK